MGSKGDGALCLLVRDPHHLREAEHHFLQHKARLRVHLVQIIAYHLQGLGVGHSDVTADPPGHHGMPVGDPSVQFLPGGEPADAGPLGLVEVHPVDPFTLVHQLGPLRHRLEHGVTVTDHREVHPEGGKAHGQEVGVGIDEAGDQGELAAIEVDVVLVHHRLQLLVGANGDDAAVPAQDRLRPWPARVQRYDVGVVEQEGRSPGWT